MFELDLLLLVLNLVDVEVIVNRMSEFSNAAFERLMESGVLEFVVSIIIVFLLMLKYYDIVVDSCGVVKVSDVVNFIVNEIIGVARKDVGVLYKELLLFLLCVVLV